MAEAYVLAGELSRSPHEYHAAFERYQNRLRKFVEGKQQTAVNAAATFVPKTRFQMALRNVFLRLLPSSFVAKLGLGSLIDDIELPVYEVNKRTPSSTSTAT